MPDFINPKTEFWILTFCCDLHRFDGDMATITGCCFPEMNEAATEAMKATVEGLLQALEKDAKSVPLNHDLCFYPCCSVELISIIGKSVVPNGNGKEDFPATAWKDYDDTIDGETLEVVIPAHATSLICRLAKYLNETDSTDPIIIMPSSPKNGGHLLFLPDHPSFLCSWDGVDCGFGLYFLPDYNNFIVVQGRNSMGPHITIYYPPRSGLLAITPTTEVASVQNLTIVQPKNLSMPLLELPLPDLPSAPMNCDDLIALVMTLRESLADPRAGMPNGNPWVLPASLIPSDFPIKYDVRSGVPAYWNPMDATSRKVDWAITSKGTKQLSSLMGSVSLPTISNGQGTQPQQAICQPRLLTLMPAVENGNGQPTSQLLEVPAIGSAAQVSAVLDGPTEADLLCEQMDEDGENIPSKCPSPTSSRFRIIRLPESERATNWGLYPDPVEDECADPASTLAPNGVPSSLQNGSGQTPRNQTQNPKPAVIRRQSMQYSDLMHQQRLLSPIAEGKKETLVQQRSVRRTESERVLKPLENIERAPYMPPGPGLMQTGKPVCPVPGLSPDTIFAFLSTFMLLEETRHQINSTAHCSSPRFSEPAECFSNSPTQASHIWQCPFSPPSSSSSFTEA
ncbi:hypothetical protein TcWFU_000842 [Taenia crassiceps]|uniref:Uncharacterized protein n=1 Tax=Taenia crassiceps TaxID=6207 RepID=A0ABR4QFR4_9CEST